MTCIEQCPVVAPKSPWVEKVALEGSRLICVVALVVLTPPPSVFSLSLSPLFLSPFLSLSPLSHIGALSISFLSLILIFISLFPLFLSLFTFDFFYHPLPFSDLCLSPSSLFPLSLISVLPSPPPSLPPSLSLSVSPPLPPPMSHSPPHSYFPRHSSFSRKLFCRLVFCRVIGKQGLVLLVVFGASGHLRGPGMRLR